MTRVLVFSWIYVFGFGSPLWALELEVQPLEPLETAPVSVVVSDEYPNNCYELCNVTGQWVTDRHYQIDWHIAYQSGPQCLKGVYPLASQISLGLLLPGRYTVTVRQYLDSFTGSGCPVGFPIRSIELIFCVGSPCQSACDDGNECTIEGCGVGGGECAHWPFQLRHGDVFRDGMVDVDDIGCMISGFIGNAECTCSDEEFDLAPCGGNGIFDVDDILALLAAFAGHHLCPDPCP